jgi:hypothetical protein
MTTYLLPPGINVRHIKFNVPRRYRCHISTQYRSSLKMHLPTDGKNLHPLLRIKPAYEVQRRAQPQEQTVVHRYEQPKIPNQPMTININQPPAMMVPMPQEESRPPPVVVQATTADSGCTSVCCCTTTIILLVVVIFLIMSAILTLFAYHRFENPFHRHHFWFLNGNETGFERGNGGSGGDWQN